MEKHARELEPEDEKPEKETLYPSPQTLAFLKRERRSKHSLLFVALLCLGLGILVLGFFFVMKPEVKNPQILAKRYEAPRSVR